MRNIWSFFIFIFIFFSCQENVKKLPILGPTEIIQMPFDAYAVGDTLYHVLPFFEMQNQKADTISSLDYRGKIHLANFFFATCPQVCPLMMDKINQLAKKLKDTPIYFLSFSVNPEQDTPKILAQYAEDHHLEMQHWQLLTGDKAEIYALARRGYLLAAGEDAESEGGFFHSTQIVLVDSFFQIRGIYDTQSDKELMKLEKDIQLLIQEERNEQ